MKFFRAAIALVAAIATSSGADATVPNNKRELKKVLDHRMKNGLFDRRTLMKGAQPYSDAAKEREDRRKLDYGDINGAFSVQFQSCFSLTTSYQDLFEDNDNQGGGMKMGMFQNGNLMALKSYAIFRLCYNGQCGSNGNNGMLDYVVDLDTYVRALVNYLPDQMEGFCEGCMENQESCLTILYGGYAGAYANNNGQNSYRQNYNAYENNYNGANVNYVNYGYGGNYGGNQANAYQGGYNNGNDNGNANANGYQNGYNNNGGGQQQGQAYQNGYDNGGNRKLAELAEFEKRVLQNGQVVKQLDCNLCMQYGCLSDDDAGQGDVYSFEAASEWLQETAECRETGIQYSGYSGNSNGYYQQQGGDENQIFAGFICNSDGSGVELGLFLDEECVLYLTNEPYSNYMSYFDQTYVEMTKEIIEFTFSNAVLSCKEEEITYTTQQVGQYGMYNYQDWNGDQDQEIAEWCDELISGGESEPVDISSCGTLNGQYYQQQYDQNYQQDRYQNYYQQYQEEDENMQYQYMYDWYRYEITLQNSYDMYEVCRYMKNTGDGLHTFYNSNNGYMYDYASTANSASDTISEFMEGSDNEVDYTESSSLSFYNRTNLNAAQKFGIVAGAGIIVGAAIALFLRFRTTAEDSKEEALIDDEVSQKGEAA